MPLSTLSISVFFNSFSSFSRSLSSFTTGTSLLWVVAGVVVVVVLVSFKDFKVNQAATITTKITKTTITPIATFLLFELGGADCSCHIIFIVSPLKLLVQQRLWLQVTLYSFLLFVLLLANLLLMFGNLSVLL